ncbi:hypothetical protein AB0I72_02725 [Nocardiopsis sp. NPDC049922]|uniref:hypothetical protein n=1 Tax=Nocardiopsis sp. NPDC049922 TaxID=3155157 RepID=UPI0033F210DB
MNKLPILDPTLPEAIHRAVREKPDSLIATEPGTAPVGRGHRFGRAVRGVAVLVLSIALMITVQYLYGRWWSMAAGCASLFLYLPPRPEEDRLRNALRTGASTILPWWIWAIPMSSFGAWFPFGILHLVTFNSFVGGAPKQEVRVPRDRFVLPSEIARADRDRLRRMREVIGTVERAQTVLTPGFDGRDALLVLREEEWRLAESMRRIAPLAREINDLDGRAASHRVREAMRPQIAVLDEVRAAHAAAVDRAESYIGPVKRALTAHEEWEQCQRLAASGGAFADVLAETRGRDHGSLAGAPDLESDTALQAARLTLTRRTDEAAEANAWLLNAVRGGNR